MHDLLLYNSLSQNKEIFRPRNPQAVGMYVCGMTVYDYCHIGHARVMVVFDVLARLLRKHYPSLKYVRNITDIDDKIINKANELQEDIRSLTDRYIQAMHEDERALFCLLPDVEPRATDYVAQMQTMIQTLIEKGHAYVGENGDVYYAVRTFEGYGKLSHRNLDDLRAGERVQINTAKRDPLDFVLWKKAKAGEPSWASPWGDGRPGWHIECSAMSLGELGEYFDLHGGGMDLKFPHHECEIAQSEGACDHQTVGHWVHNGFVQIDNEKMSKSLGNFFTVREVLEHYDGEVIRLFMLQTHYRSPLNYSDTGLKETQKALVRLYAAIEQAPLAGEVLKESEHAFFSALNDDLNTAKALSILFELVKAANKQEENAAFTLKHLANFLGLLQQDPARILKGQGDVDEMWIQSLVQARLQAKKDRDFAKADEIRNELLAKGVVIKDTPQGTEWSFVN